MKRSFRAVPSKRVVASVDTQLDSQDVKLLNSLAGDMLHQVWENYPESSEEDAYELVLDHVILVITEMDDGEDPMYADLVSSADYDNEEFCQLVRSVVDNHYDDYDWYEM